MLWCGWKQIIFNPHGSIQALLKIIPISWILAEDQGFFPKKKKKQI